MFLFPFRPNIDNGHCPLRGSALSMKDGILCPFSTWTRDAALNGHSSPFMTVRSRRRSVLANCRLHWQHAPYWINLPATWLPNELRQIQFPPLQLPHPISPIQHPTQMSCASILRFQGGVHPTQAASLTARIKACGSPDRHARAWPSEVIYNRFGNEILNCQTYPNFKRRPRRNGAPRRVFKTSKEGGVEAI